MVRFIAARLAGGIATVLVSTVVIFAMVRFIPGDPISARLATGGLSESAVEVLRHNYGLDQSLLQQYFSWLTTIMRGDFGVSLGTGQPIGAEVLSRVPRTIYLAVGGLAVAVVLGFSSAIVAARFAGGPLDRGLSMLSSLFISMPNFVVGTLVVALIAVKLGLLPVSGYVDPRTDLVGFFQCLALPAVSLGVPASGVIARVLRSSLAEEMSRDYVRTARARGATISHIIIRHALRNASLPTVTMVGLQLGYLLGGALVVEILFSYPGLGQLLLGAITQRDYPVVQACLLLFATGFVLVNLLTDLVYAVLNPRLEAS